VRAASSLVVAAVPYSRHASWPSKPLRMARKFSPSTRTFRFTYNFTVKHIPSPAKRVRVGVPVIVYHDRS
jgi:hypothetical protein